MTGHNEALEAANIAYWDDSVVGLKALEAAIRTYLSTLTADTAGLVERAARAWASIDGKAAQFDLEANPQLVVDDPAYEGTYEGYMAEAQELLDRSGLTDTITALTAENAALKALVDMAGEALEPLKRGIDASVWHDVGGEKMKRILVALTAIERVDSTLTAIKEARHAGN